MRWENRGGARQGGKNYLMLSAKVLSFWLLHPNDFWNKQFMPRIISKSSISNSTRSAMVTSWKNWDLALLYIYLTKIDSPKWVDSKKGSERILGLT